MNSSPASMVSFILFTDDKLLKFYHCSHKNDQNDHFHSFVGIAWLLHLPARQCTSTHGMRNGSVFVLPDPWFHVPKLLRAETMNIFYQWTKYKVHRRSRVATDSTSWDKEACAQHTLWRQRYIATSKEYLTNGQILLEYFKLAFFQLHCDRPSDGVFCLERACYKQTRNAFQSSCLTGARLWAVITLQTLWWEIGGRSVSWNNFVYVGL